MVARVMSDLEWKLAVHVQVAHVQAHKTVGSSHGTLSVALMDALL